MTSSKKTKLYGKCTCGSVRYELTMEPMFVHCCHCTWCQRETGSAFAINALVESEYVVQLSGQMEATQIPTISGDGQKLCRCSSCKVVLWSHYGAAKDAVKFVRVGTLEDPNLCPPDIHIYTSTKQNWVVLDGSVPMVEEYYQRSKYWPKESVERYKRALGKPSNS